MIDALLEGLLYLLVPILSLGVLGNNPQCLAPARKLNTRLLLMPRLNLFGLKPLFVNLVFHSRRNHVYGVIILVLHISLPIRFFMLAPSTLRLILILFEKGLLASNLM